MAWIGTLGCSKILIDKGANMINDNQTLVGATYHSGHPIPTYDDGFGPIFISRNSIGINGIVRAQTWEDAYSICEDEFFSECDMTIDELRTEYGFKREHVKIVKDAGIERDVTPNDYPNGRLADHLTFVRWETRETPDADAWMDNELFQESFGFRPSGLNKNDKMNHAIYQKDLNGDSLDRLTPELANEIGIVLEIKDSE